MEHLFTLMLERAVYGNFDYVVNVTRNQFNKFKAGSFGLHSKWSQYVKQDNYSKFAGEFNRICRGVFLIKLFEDLNVLPIGVQLNPEWKSMAFAFIFSVVVMLGVFLCFW